MISVAIDRYDGPLDVLLSLVRRNEYPPEDLPIAEITRQFLEYVKGSGRPGAENPGEDLVEDGGDFIETASWLVLLKSRSMLPVAPGEEPPQQELRRVLLDHETMQKTAEFLGDRLAWTGLASGAPSNLAGVAFPEGEDRIAPAPTIQDLLLAARRALERARTHAALAPTALPAIHTVEEQIALVREQLDSLPCSQAISTQEWFDARPAAEARIALLLALLELARLDELLLAQPQTFGPVYLQKSAV